MTIQKLKDRLDSIKKLSSNWNGYEALSMNEENYHDALVFINKCEFNHYGIYMNEEGIVEMAFFNKPVSEDLMVEINNGNYRILDDEQVREFTDINDLISFMNRLKKECDML